MTNESPALSGESRDRLHLLRLQSITARLWGLAPPAVGLKRHRSQRSASWHSNGLRYCHGFANIPNMLIGFQQPLSTWYRLS